MNTAFHDALNLAWKLHHVEGGFANRSVLSTYESERKQIAEELLSFDAKYAALFSQRQPSATEVDAASRNEGDGAPETEFMKVFKESTEFTTGYAIAYGANEYNWSSSHPARSNLFNPKGNKLVPGRIMPTANVTRVVDANEVQLEHEIFLFAGAPRITGRAVTDFAYNLERKKSFYSTFQREDIARVSCHERHNPHSHFFTICTIFASARDELEISALLPGLLGRYSHHVYADDLKDSRVPHANAAAHGGIVVVRPDGHVGCVVGLAEGGGTVDALSEYFAASVSKPIGMAGSQPQL